MTQADAARPRPHRWRVAVPATAAVGALVLAGQLVDTGAEPGGPVALTAAVALSFTAMGVLVLAGAPRHGVGRLMLAAGVCAAVAAIATSWTGWGPLAWLSKWTWWLPFGLVFLALLAFPDGRLPSPRWHWLAAVIGGATLVTTVGLAVAAADHPRTLLTSLDEPLTGRARLALVIAFGALLVSLLGLLGVVAALGTRWRRADGVTRRQIACLLPGAALLLLGLILNIVGVTGLWPITAAAVPLGMTVAVLQYRLYDLDQLINRTLVWIVLTVLVVVSFVALVAVLREVLTSGSDDRASLVATGLIVLTFQPAHRRVQRWVNRMLYGERDDPYEVIARLGELLGHTAEPTRVLPSLVHAIAGSLRVPYVAVELEGPGGPRLAASDGEATTVVEAFEMVAHSETVGRLLVARRRSGDRFTRRERRLLEDVALHAAVAAEDLRLIHDLQESREKLVVAREEERRRLRRELHDGVGPTLVGMSMELQAARRILQCPARAEEILATLADDLTLCMSEVRQLVDQLRPPALDNGLEAALRLECKRFDSPELAVSLTVGHDLRGLPAAVEVAVYRIVGEALTNVARHAAARSCRVSVQTGRSLVLEVSDDGAGMPDAIRHGVGIHSMRERVVELGGELHIATAPRRGTTVRARLPLAAVAGVP
ncbi:sensor histidine kinase [Actinoplanes sp. URMC 104]|uniref:sensor histidine kinase n=1 Tax=Actinoplanes sp. URMC 104 TaxID=3423409 RepID=UPI003F1C26B7